MSGEQNPLQTPKDYRLSVSSASWPKQAPKQCAQAAPKRERPSNRPSNRPSKRPSDLSTNW